MTEPFDDAWEEAPPSTASDEDREVLAQHDPLGIDLASQIAQGTKSLLPPPRGVAKRRKKRREWVDSSVRSGSGPDARDPQLLGKALTRVISERGWQREVNLRHLLDSWEGLVGATNAAHSRPESYTDTVLVVRCDSTVWATSLRTLAPSLVAELNRQLGDGTVTRIVPLGPSAPSWKHGPRSVRDGRGPRDTYG